MPDDPVKVKQLLEWATKKSIGQPVEDPPEIDAATRQQLEAWFGVPSYTAMEEAGTPVAPPIDADMERVQKQREAAMAAIDPSLLDALRTRAERCNTMPKFVGTIDIGNGLRIDETMPLLDATMVERVGSIADPREVELSEDLRDDLKDCTPQALLRDLHRAVIDFEKTFETNDLMLAHRVDVAGLVTEVMSTRWSLPPPGMPLFTEGTQLLREVAALRRVPSTDIPRPNRRVEIDGVT